MFFFKYVADGMEGGDNGKCFYVLQWANNGCIRVVVICHKYVFFAFIEQCRNFPAKLM